MSYSSDLNWMIAKRPTIAARKKNTINATVAITNLVARPTTAVVMNPIKPITNKMALNTVLIFILVRILSRKIHRCFVDTIT